MTACSFAEFMTWLKTAESQAEAIRQCREIYGCLPDQGLCGYPNCPTGEWEQGHE